ncbi:MAG: mechanosensitive ion channel [Betaproteobacteria bacterium]|jgi:small-conductance mechanosensitive channel/CRP-like cAMP-binding protein|nr:mechanosensitive ion channel [Betaproteobacteria bacterium]
MPSVAPLIDHAMLADVALFAGGALLLALLSLLAPPERRRGLLPLAIVAAAGLPLIFLLQRFQGDFNQQTLGIMLREATLAVTAFAVVRVATGFVFQVLLARMALPRILAELVIALALVGYALFRLNALGVNLVGIATTSAVVTGAIAFSAQETLGNLWGGLALQLERTCRIGDWIRVDNITGQVVSIRWRYLALATNDNETVVIPNASLMKNRITVLCRRGEQPMPWRRAIRFQLEFDQPPARVLPIVDAALARAGIPNVATDPMPSCICTGFGDSGVDYAVIVYLVDPQREWWTESQVRLHLFAALARAGMGIPFPRRVLEVRRDARPGIEARERAARLAALETSDLFRVLTDGERETLVGGLAACPYAADDVIFRKGEAADSLFMLCRGRVGVFDEDAADGTRVRLAELEAPSYFGEMGLLLGAPRRATVVAAGDVLCYRLDKRSFDAVLSARPELVDELSRVLVERQAHNDATLQALGAEARSRHALTRAEELVRKIRAFFKLR